MYAYAGMRLEEWEDGRVNIGLAVCPQNRTAVAIEQGNGTVVLNNDQIAPPDFIIPKSAFILRPPKKYQRSQGGFTVTYAHHPEGPSDFVIMLNSEDQDQGSMHAKVVARLEQKKHYLAQETPAITDMNDPSDHEEVEQEQVATSSKQISDGSQQSSISESEEAEQEKVEQTLNTSQEEGEQEDNRHISEEESNNHRTPQDTGESSEEIIEHETGGIVEVIVTSPRKEKTRGSPKGEASSLSGRKSSDTSTMKRVSWMEEKFFQEDQQDNTSTRNNNSHNSKENKRESGRKSNGFGGSGNNHRSSSTRKHHHHQQHHQQHQQEFLSGEESSSTVEGYVNTVAATTASGKRSGDKSRIPTIGSGGGEYPASCEFYRRKMLREFEHCYNNNSNNGSPPTLADNWYGYTSLQRYAGQKVRDKGRKEID